VIKCVVWDLDNTLFRGVYLESPEPPADPALAAMVAELAGRGILQAIASRNPPEAAEYAAGLTGHDFASVRCGWQAKSASIAAIMDDLGLTAAEVAFVDDDAMERAEVSYTVPDVLVLAPQDLPDAASWPQFSPPVVTGEARRRGELYQQRRARQEEAKAFGGSPGEFLRHIGTTVRISRAGPDDAPRLHELSVRTHQFNSTGVEVSAIRFGELIGAGQVMAVWLSDKFGDDGLVGACIVESGTVESDWRASLLMMSCRALGRGVIDALLAWLCLSAKNAGAGLVAVPCVVNDRNVPLRIALTGAGFRAMQTQGGTAEYVRRLDQPLPDVPEWVNAAAPDVTAQVRRVLAELVSDAMPLTAPASTRLLREGVGLDSLGGALLLARIQARFGVDVADEDLNLDSLATIGTLAAFVSDRIIGRQAQ
jgi:methoxymalonate biosynthesis protein